MVSRTKSQTALSDRPDSPDEEIPEWARKDEGGQSVATAPERLPGGDGQVDGAGAGDGQTEETLEGVIGSATPALDNLLAWLVAEAVEDEGDSLTGLESIVRDALTAENPADVLRQRMPAAAGNWVGIPLRLHGYVIRHSDYEDSKGLPFYVSLKVECGEPPEHRAINTSATKVLAQVKRLAELDQWPYVVQIIETRRAKKGQDAPLGLTIVD